MNEGDTSFCEEVLLSIFSELEDHLEERRTLVAKFLSKTNNKVFLFLLERKEKECGGQGL